MLLGREEGDRLAVEKRSFTSRAGRFNGSFLLPSLLRGNKTHAVKGGDDNGEEDDFLLKVISFAF